MGSSQSTLLGDARLGRCHADRFLGPCQAFVVGTIQFRFGVNGPSATGDSRTAPSQSGSFSRNYQHRRSSWAH